MITTISIIVLCTIAYLGVGAFAASKLAIDTNAVALLLFAWPLALVVAAAIGVYCLVASIPQLVVGDRCICKRLNTVRSYEDGNGAARCTRCGKQAPAGK